MDTTTLSWKPALKNCGVRDSWILEDDFWVAEAADGSLVGCIRLSSDTGAGGELETCFVAPDYKGKGRRTRAVSDT